MPGVDVAGEQHEPVLAAAGQRADEVGDRRPARPHARGQRHPQGTARETLAQPFAVGAEDREARRGRDAPRRLRRRRAPDRRHDHVVQVIQRHEDLRERARLLRRPGLAGRRQPANERDLAGGPRKLGRSAVADVDDLGL